MFCSKCGLRLPAAAPAQPASSSPPPSAPPATKAPSVPPKRRVAGAAKTMLGVPTPLADDRPTEADDPHDEPPHQTHDEPASATEATAAPPPEAPAPEPPLDTPIAPPTVAAPANAHDDHATEDDADHETTEDDADHDADHDDASPVPKGAPRRPVAGSARTMLGMPAPDKAAVAAAVQQAKAERAEAASRREEPEPSTDAPEAKPAARSRAAALGSSNRTMIGQPAPKVVPAEAAPAPRSEPPPPKPASVPPGPRERAPVVYPNETSEEVPLTLPVKRTGTVAKVILGLGLVALVVGLGALGFMALRGSSDLRATVVQGEDGEMLQIEVPGAVEGTRLRFHGSEQPLETGRARFPLRAEDLVLGDNELAVDVLAPDGAVRTETLELHLALRVRADLGPLASSPPAFDVVVEAPAGSTATLDGEPLELDASGRGTRRYPVEATEADAEGRVERVVRYRVVPPEGQAAQGELRTRVPLTALRIDRPGHDLVTDAATIEVAGAVGPGATVTVAGTSVEVRESRFVTRHPLPQVGEHTIEVVARAPGKAPHLERIRVRRVADLAAEAARFEVEPDLTYARIQQNPALYRGRRVAFEGSVFNVDVREGRSIVQMVVDDCTAGQQRCPLWVTYPGATDVARGQRVRVLGTVVGEQQYRSQSNEIRTDPRVDATFVLPVTADAPRRR